MQVNDKMSSNVQWSDTGAQAPGNDVMHMDPVGENEFRAIMERQARQAADGGHAVSGAAGNGLGERIIGRATALSGQLHNDQQYISKTLEQAARAGDSMQLMKAMLALSDYETRVQFISKAASKAASAVDQLTKLQ
jgi:hypothetical protein